jgi:hypothetical protein
MRYMIRLQGLWFRPETFDAVSLETADVKTQGYADLNISAHSKFFIHLQRWQDKIQVIITPKKQLSTDLGAALHQTLATSHTCTNEA